MSAPRREEPFIPALVRDRRPLPRHHPKRQLYSPELWSGVEVAGFTYRQIEVFMTICEVGSFRRAADVLNLSEPSVSHHVRMLESYVGFKLFRRHRGSLASLTRSGEHFRQATDLFIEAVQDIRNSQSSGDHAEAKLAMYVGPLLLEQYVRPALPNLIKFHPKITLRFSRPAPRPVVIRELETEQLDGALLVVQGECDFPKSELISRFSFGLYGNTEFRKKYSINNISDIPIILCEFNIIDSNDQIRFLKSLGVDSPTISGSSQFFDEAVALAAQGRGAFLTLTRMIDKSAAGSDLVLLSEEYLLESRLFLNPYVSNDVRSLISDFFRSVLPSDG